MLKKILMLNYEFPPIGGGASPVSYDIGKGLAEQGHEVTVVTMAYQDLPELEVVDGMTIYRVRCLRKQAMVCHPWEQASYIIAAVRFLDKYLKTNSFDLCYAHFIIPTGVIALYLKKKYKLRYIITAHGSDVIGHNNKRFGKLYQFVKKPWQSICRGADCIISPSRYLADLIQTNEPRAKCRVIQNGVDTNFFQKSTGKKKQILVMCRLQETKNVQCVLRALKGMHMGEWQVKILGDGPYKSTLVQMVTEYGLEKTVSFEGWVENKSREHLRYLQETAIYLSASEVENCPTSILEALSCGDHVLLSDIPAHKQLVEAVDRNVFFERNNENELRLKLQQLMERLEQQENMSNAYDVRIFDWKNSILQYEEVIG
jgi:glycosyltransferase involved in cell wall biosynthesis